MTHRNVIRFRIDPPRELILVAEGTVWPSEVIVDGEGWLMGDVVDGGPGFCVREYVMAERATPSQRLFKAIRGGA